MAYSITERFKNAWNAFTSRDPTVNVAEYSYGSSFRPDRRYSYRSSDKSIITTVFNRIAVDASQVDIRHVRLDDKGKYAEDIKSGLNDALTISANIDQTGRAFVLDAVYSMLEEGCIALVPTVTDINPEKTGSYDIKELRVGQILEWYPKHVRLNLYNDQTARREEITLPKSMVAIVENPFYSIMNEPNSTLQRLIRTLNHLDIANEKNASGKLDLIISLPYTVKTPLKQQQAEARRKEIEMQLVGSKYGIAYTDGTERITQLNRPLENNLWKEAQDLQTMLFNQLGLTQSIFDGTADEKALNNYYSRTIEPILSAITEEMIRKFLTPTAITQKQSIKFFRDPFKLVTIADLADVGERFTRNEILSSNEVRSIMGMKPVNTARADELVNKNLYTESGPIEEIPADEEIAAEETPEEIQNGSEVDDEESELDRDIEIDDEEESDNEKDLPKFDLDSIEKDLKDLENLKDDSDEEEEEVNIPEESFDELDKALTALEEETEETEFEDELKAVTDALDKILKGIEGV